MRDHAPFRRPAVVVAVLYVIVLALIAYWPTPVDRGIDPVLWHVLFWLHFHGAPAWFGYGVVEFGANIAMFAPLGLLVVLIAGVCRWWWGIVLSVLASCAIELGQLLFLPDRVASLGDIVANSLGGMLGTGVGVLVVVLRNATRRRAAVAAHP